MIVLRALEAFATAFGVVFGIGTLISELRKGEDA